MRARLCLFTAALLLAGCGESTQQRSDDVATLSVVDDSNRRVQLVRPAERIVSLVPVVTDLLIALGHADRLIARTDYDVDARVSHLPSVGGGLTPSVEWLVVQRPDLVISWPDQPARSLVSRLTAVGIPVYGARTERIDDTFRTIANLGVLLDVHTAADSLTSQLKAGLDSVRAVVAGRPRVRVAYVLSTDPATVAGPGTFIDELITIAGGSNVFADIGRLWPQVNLEELVTRDPDAIVNARDDQRNALAVLRALPGWRDLRAVRAGRVHRVSPDFFNRSGPRMPRAAQELATFFHRLEP